MADGDPNSPDTVAERDELDRLIDGERAALAALYRRHRRSVMLYALSMISSRPDAEEVLQDAFVTLWNKRATLTRVEGSVLPWLLVTTRNVALNRRRSMARRSASSLETAAEVRSRESDPADAAQYSELRGELDRAIRSLPEVDQRIVELCLVDGLTYQQAATQLGVSTPTVRNRLSRLRLRLRSALALHVEEVP